MLENIREKEILPAGEEDFAIPSRVAMLDSHIKYLQEQIVILESEIAGIQIDRTGLLARANYLHICEDRDYRIVSTPIYDRKRVDVSALKELAPDKMELILANIKARLEDKMKADLGKAESFVAQADVKAVVRDKVLLARIIPEQTVPVSWEIVVVKKEG